MTDQEKSVLVGGVSELLLFLCWGDKDSGHSITSQKSVGRRADGQEGAGRQTDSHGDTLRGDI